MRVRLLAQKTWTLLVAAVLTGALVALSAPGVLPIQAASWLAWIAFVPILLVVPEASPKRAALSGWVASLACQLVAASWFPGLVARFGGLHPALAVAIGLVIAAVQSLGWASWTLTLRILSPSHTLVLIAPVTFLAMEYSMPLIFPYGLGLTQVNNQVIAQAAELGGPYLVGALLVAFSAAIAGLIRSRKQGTRAAVAVAAVLAMAAAFGWFRLKQVERVWAQAPTMRVGWVQAGVIHTGWTPSAHDSPHIESYQKASEALERVEGPVDLMIWPEKAYGLLLRNAKHDYRPASPRRIRKGFVSPLLFGLTSVDRATRRIDNAAALLEGGGRLRVVYEKVRLIPFSERLPAWLEGKVPGGKRYQPGSSLAPFRVPLRDARGGRAQKAVPVGVFICFESAFPSHVRAITRKGARVLVNISDDTWFGDSAEPEQHLAHVVLRAIENRRDIVRVTGGGVSALVTATGGVTHRTELNRMPSKAGVGRVGEAHLLGMRSLSAGVGDAVPIACALASLLWIAGFLRERLP